MGSGKWFAAVLGVATLAASASANAQVVALSAGFLPDPRMMSGVAGGPVAGRTLGPSCAGWMPATAQHRMVIQSPMPFLRVWVGASNDTTLAVRAPTGQVFCADDTWGVNPGVDILGATPGQYEIFVGSYSQGVVAPYNVGFSEQRSSTPLSTAGAIAAAPAPGGGGGSAPVVGGNPCGGGGGAPIGGGNPCGGGGAPVIGGGNPCGGGAIAPMPPPPMNLPPAGGGVFPIASGFVPDPRIFAGVSGGPVSAQQMNPACRGWVGATPNQVIQLTTTFNYLRFWVRSQGDTTLLIRAPTGQSFCADDTWGLNPGVDLNGLPPGTYQVFVGSYATGMNFPFQLGLTENPQSTPNGGIAPVAPVQPMMPQPMGGYGAVTLASGFVPDPQMRTGVSGGPISAMSQNSSCRGYISAQPSQTMYLQGAFNFLRVYVQSQSDTTLMIRGPNGETWCSDDVWGFNPGLDMRGAEPGAYQLYVGSYSMGNSAAYSVGFTENPNVHP